MRKIIFKIYLFALAFFLNCTGGASAVYGATGTVYTCVIHPTYNHPVTGEIEDSGGESSYATGQGMVESAVYTTGILEVTDEGQYYLTIRIGLLDYASGHNFWVQSVGDSAWSSPSVGVTNSGSDSNGVTNDICIQVSSENCVVRVSMYVQPMGRDVIFYLYPSDYVAGNNTDMVATMVSGSAAETETTEAASTASAQSGENQEDSLRNTEQSQADNTQETTLESTPEEENNTESDKTSEESASVADAPQETLKSDITQEATPSSRKENQEESANGLTLSTEADVAQAEDMAYDDSVGNLLLLFLALTSSGLILIGVASAVVYYFRRNWYRWGGEDDE